MYKKLVKDIYVNGCGLFTRSSDFKGRERGLGCLTGKRTICSGMLQEVNRHFCKLNTVAM